MGVVEWWRRFIDMPDRERAKLLALILGGIIVGVLYALGGLSLYLRSGYLTPSATRMQVTRIGVESGGQPSGAESPLAVSATSLPASGEQDRPAATLYPTVTPDLTKTALAEAPAVPLAAPLPVTETPYPTPMPGETIQAGSP